MEKEFDLILKTLWAIREGDEFYFQTYGRECLEDLSRKSFQAAREKVLKHSTISHNGTTQNKYVKKYNQFKNFKDEIR